MKNPLDKGKLWEKRRRDRLKESFHQLAQLLPQYDPAKIPSQKDILDKATQFVKELRLSNSRLLQHQTQTDEKNKLIQELQDEVNRLILRVKQLTTLLKTAKISIPTGPTIKSLGKRKLKWSEKLSPDDVENKKKKKPNPKEKQAKDSARDSEVPAPPPASVTPLRETNAGNPEKEPAISESIPPPPPRETTNTVIQPQMVTSMAPVHTLTFSLPVQTAPTTTIILTPQTLPVSPLLTRIAVPAPRILPKPSTSNPVPKFPILRVTQPIIKVKRTRQRKKKLPPPLPSKNGAATSGGTSKPAVPGATSKPTSSPPTVVKTVPTEPEPETFVDHPVLSIIETNEPENAEPGIIIPPEPVQVPTEAVAEKSSPSSPQKETPATVATLTEESPPESSKDDQVQQSRISKTTENIPKSNSTVTENTNPVRIVENPQNFLPESLPGPPEIEKSNAESAIPQNQDQDPVTNTEKSVPRIVESAKENSSENFDKNISPPAIQNSAPASSQELLLPEPVVQVTEKPREPPPEIPQAPTEIRQPPTEIPQRPTEIPQPPTEIPQRSTEIPQPPTEIPPSSKPSDENNQVIPAQTLEPIVPTLSDQPKEQNNSIFPPSNKIEGHQPSAPLISEPIQPRELDSPKNPPPPATHTISEMSPPCPVTQSSSNVPQAVNLSESLQDIADLMRPPSNPPPSAKTTSERLRDDSDTTDKISECIARSIDLIDQPEAELMELGGDWGESRSPKSPISPTQMFLSMFPLLPRESLISSTEPSNPKQSFSNGGGVGGVGNGGKSSSFYIDSMLPDESSGDNFPRIPASLPTTTQPSSMSTNLTIANLLSTTSTPSVVAETLQPPTSHSYLNAEENSNPFSIPSMSMPTRTTLHSSFSNLPAQRPAAEKIPNPPAGTTRSSEFDFALSPYSNLLHSTYSSNSITKDLNWSAFQFPPTSSSSSFRSTTSTTTPTIGPAAANRNDQPENSPANAETTGMSTKRSKNTTNKENPTYKPYATSPNNTQPAAVASSHQQQQSKTTENVKESPAAGNSNGTSKRSKATKGQSPSRRSRDPGRSSGASLSTPPKNPMSDIYTPYAFHHQNNHQPPPSVPPSVVANCQTDNQFSSPYLQTAAAGTVPDISSLPRFTSKPCLGQEQEQACAVVFGGSSSSRSSDSRKRTSNATLTAPTNTVAPCPTPSLDFSNAFYDNILPQSMHSQLALGHHGSKGQRHNQPFYLPEVPLQNFDFMSHAIPSPHQIFPGSKTAGNRGGGGTHHHHHHHHHQQQQQMDKYNYFSPVAAVPAPPAGAEFNYHGNFGMLDSGSSLYPSQGVAGDSTGQLLQPPPPSLPPPAAAQKKSDAHGSSRSSSSSSSSQGQLCQGQSMSSVPPAPPSVQGQNRNDSQGRGHSQGPGQSHQSQRGSVKASAQPPTSNQAQQQEHHRGDVGNPVQQQQQQQSNSKHHQSFQIHSLQHHHSNLPGPQQTHPDPNQSTAQQSAFKQGQDPSRQEHESSNIGQTTARQSRSNETHRREPSSTEGQSRSAHAPTEIHPPQREPPTQSHAQGSTPAQNRSQSGQIPLQPAAGHESAQNRNKIPHQPHQGHDYQANHGPAHRQIHGHHHQQQVHSSQTPHSTVSQQLAHPLMQSPGHNGPPQHRSHCQSLENSSYQQPPPVHGQGSTIQPIQTSQQIPPQIQQQQQQQQQSHVRSTTHGQSQTHRATHQPTAHAGPSQPITSHVQHHHQTQGHGQSQTQPNQQQQQQQQQQPHGNGQQQSQSQQQSLGHGQQQQQQQNQKQSHAHSQQPPAQGQQQPHGHAQQQLHGLHQQKPQSRTHGLLQSHAHQSRGSHSQQPSHGSHNQPQQQQQQQQQSQSHGQPHNHGQQSQIPGSQPMHAQQQQQQQQQNHHQQAQAQQQQQQQQQQHRNQAQAPSHGHLQPSKHHQSPGQTQNHGQTTVQSRTHAQSSASLPSQVHAQVHRQQGSSGALVGHNNVPPPRSNPAQAGNQNQPIYSNNSGTNPGQHHPAAQSHARPVNWMTDPPAPPAAPPASSCSRKPTIPNPFSVSKLVGNTQSSSGQNSGGGGGGGSNNYCVEGLIRKSSNATTSDWTDFPPTPVSYIHPQNGSQHHHQQLLPTFTPYQTQADYGGYATNFTTHHGHPPGQSQHQYPHHTVGHSVGVAQFDHFGHSLPQHHQLHHGNAAPTAHNALPHQQTPSGGGAHGTAQAHQGSSVLNFNLSSIFPEMNDKRNSSTSNGSSSSSAAGCAFYSNRNPANNE